MAEIFTKQFSFSHSNFFSLLIRILGLLIFTLFATLALIHLPVEAKDLPSTTLMRPGDAKTGTLLFKSNKHGKYIPAPLLGMHLEAEVTGPILRARLTQRFRNPSDQWVEAIYAFPLHETSAVDHMRMRIGDRVIEAEIKERIAAKKIYEAAKKAGKKAGLIEQERPNIFTSSVANIGPGETVDIQIEYQHAIDRNGAARSLRVPMTIGVRFDPAMLTKREGDATALPQNLPSKIQRVVPPYREPGAGPEHPVQFEIMLKPGFPIRNIKSDTHPLRIERLGGDVVRISPAGGVVPADRDLEINWQPEINKAPSAALFRERIGGWDYFLIAITPPESIAPDRTPPRDVVFVLDSSGSMAGESIRQAKASILWALRQMTHRDRFNVIEFGTDTIALYSALQFANQKKLQEAERFVGGIDATGGTMMRPALELAMGQQNAPAPANTTHREKQIIFITDGNVSNEAELFSRIATEIGDSRLFTVGIGSAPNAYFMRRSARIGHGAFEFINNPGEVDRRMAALFKKIAAPQLRDLAVEISASALRPIAQPDASNFSLIPSPIPDLYTGEPLYLALRMPATNSRKDVALSISGKQSGATGVTSWRRGMALKEAPEGKGIHVFWARRKIEQLSESRFFGADNSVVKQAITHLGLTHHLVTPYTSLVAVDKMLSRDPANLLHSQKVPSLFPAGWKWESVFGKVQTGQTGIFRNLKPVAPPQKLDENAPAHLRQTQIRLPQGGSMAPLLLRVGIICALLSLLLWGWGRRFGAHGP